MEKPPKASNFDENILAHQHFARKIFICILEEKIRLPYGSNLVEKNG